MIGNATTAPPPRCPQCGATLYTFLNVVAAQTGQVGKVTEMVSTCPKCVVPARDVTVVRGYGWGV